MVEISHDFLKDVCSEEAICVDATLGKARDTLFFLEHPIQKVYAFEVQKELIEQAKSIQDPRLKLLHKGHENIDEIEEDLDAILFNLGYCPGDQQGIKTQTKTTLLAIQKGIKKLKIKGRMAIVCYPHEEGKQEKKAILTWLEKQNDIQYQLMDNGNIHSPCCIQIEKISDEEVDKNG